MIALVRLCGVVLIWAQVGASTHDRNCDAQYASCFLQKGMISSKHLDVEVHNTSLWRHVEGSDDRGEVETQVTSMSGNTEMGFTYIRSIWQQSIDGLKYAAEHHSMRVLIPSIIFFGVFLLLSIGTILRAQNSSDNNNVRSSSGFEQHSWAAIPMAFSKHEESVHLVFEVRIPLLSLTIATLTCLAGSQFAVLLSVFAGAQTAQDTFGLLHVISADDLSRKVLALGQILWNGAQVMQCLAIVCSWASGLFGSFSVWATIGTFALLPLSLYVASVGDYVFACLTVATSVVLARAQHDVQVQCFTGLRRAHFARNGLERVVHLCKVESLFSVCCLLSSMYNAEMNFIISPIG